MKKKSYSWENLTEEDCYELFMEASLKGGSFFHWPYYLAETYRIGDIGAENMIERGRKYYSNYFKAHKKKPFSRRVDQMELENRYVKMLAYLKGERKYAGQVQRLLDRDMMKHPYYGNDEECEIRTENVRRIIELLEDNPPMEEDTQESYTEAFFRRLKEVFMIKEQRKAITHAWSERDFTPTSDYYGIDGTKRRPKSDIKMTEEEIESFIEEIEKEVSDLKNCYYDSIREDASTLDVAKLYESLERSYRARDSKLGSIYSDYDGGPWTDGHEVAVIKGDLKLLRIAMGIMKRRYPEVFG